MAAGDPDGAVHRRVLGARAGVRRRLDQAARRAARRARFVVGRLGAGRRGAHRSAARVHGGAQHFAVPAARRPGHKPPARSGGSTCGYRGASNPRWPPARTTRSSPGARRHAGGGGSRLRRVELSQPRSRPRLAADRRARARRRVALRRPAVQPLRRRRLPDLVRPDEAGVRRRQAKSVPLQHILDALAVERGKAPYRPLFDRWEVARVPVGRLADACRAGPRRGWVTRRFADDRWIVLAAPPSR